MTVLGTGPQVDYEKRNAVYTVSENSLRVVTDSYGGCHVEIKEIDLNMAHIVKGAIKHLSEAIKITKEFDSIWIDLSLPANASNLGLIAPDDFVIGEYGKGDLIYDYQQKKIRIWQWLNSDKECAIPPGATHSMGATALIIDKVAKKVLLVVNVRRSESRNLPGGSFDPVKDNAPCYTALREAQEEGGFELPEKIVHQPKLVGQIQFPQNQFAPANTQIWTYFIDGVSQQKLNPSSDEIQLAEWIDIADIENSEGMLNGYKLGDEIKGPLKTAMNGCGFQEISNKGWMIVHTQEINK